MTPIDPDIAKVLKLAGIEQPTERDITMADRAIVVCTNSDGKMNLQRAAGILQRWIGGVKAP